MQLYIIAGPNGVGKTTFAREFLPKYADCKNFDNADLIAQAMAPFSPETAAIRAGKMMLSEIRSFAKKRVPFAFETTLSGRKLHGFASPAEGPRIRSAPFLVGRECGSCIVEGPRTSPMRRARCARSGSPSALESVHSEFSGSLSPASQLLDSV